MNKKIFLLFLILLAAVIVLSLSRDQEKNFPDLKGPYFGRQAPEKTAEVFMDGIISKKDEPEMNAAFTLDGREFYYCARYNGKWSIFGTREIKGRWKEPKPLAFTSGYTDRDFTMSPDGKKIVFGSSRPQQGGRPELDAPDICITERQPGGLWSIPKNIGPPVNSDGSENYPSLAANGNLYFFSVREDGYGRHDIYMSEFSGGKYLEPVNLGPAVNSDRNDWDSFIAPDESYIIFSSQEREDTLGGQDLYISFRKEDGGWIQAVNMGPRVNSFSGEICPSLSLDGKYFFFTSRRRGKADIYWITADIIRDLKDKLK
jgi:Tol biopolymer transport system component